ncbi:hypothetical protein KY363_03975, partial [Candidatus Woesearchaeota archaeon]|nr:hypothetical protein [Candidatus Woesearchaeota archaeon]
MRLIHLSEALRMFRRSIKVRKQGFRRYKGTPEQIAEQIIEDCWNKEKNYFMVSAGHFCEFYARDFGMCAEALVKLGHKKRVIQTLEYALSHYARHGRMTTTISPNGKCFDFPVYGADTLPFIIRAIRVAGAENLLKKYSAIITSEIDFYFDNVFDRTTDMITQGRHFSSMKDYSKRHSSCYSNCMLSMLRDDLAMLDYYNPFVKHDVKGAIMKSLWNGRFFHEDISKSATVTGDANTFPFWCGVTPKNSVFSKCVSAMEKAGLTAPFPLKYWSKRSKTAKVIWNEFFAGDYERDTIWMHLGLCFLDVVKMYDK